MPFIARKDNRKVIPEEIDDGETVTCLDCDGTLYPRGPTTDGRARHFYHPHSIGDGSGCGGGGGESDIHRKLKSLTASALRTEFAESAVQYGVELRLDAPTTDETDHRNADAYIKFETPDEQLGRGLIAEVQYRNKGKDITSTTRDYVAQGWSVCWLEPDDFDSDRCLLGESEFRRRAAAAVWPAYVPHRDHWGTGEGEYYRIRAQWLQDPPDGLSETAAEVTLPREWCDVAAQSLWRSQDWLSLFRAGHARQYIAEVQASLEPATVTINVAPWLTEEMIVDAYDAGLKHHSTVEPRLPSPQEWSGTLTLDVTPSEPEMNVIFPPDLFDAHRDELETIWRTFAHGDFDICLALSDDNASRQCRECNESAAYYIQKEGSYSGFFCRPHVQEIDLKLVSGT